MTLHEALTRCRDHGAHVRPVCWGRQPDRAWSNLLCTGHHVIWNGRVFMDHDSIRRATTSLRLRYNEELLGEWEEVPK